MKQDGVFLNGEGDNWFFRNRDKITAEKWVADDQILKMIELNGIVPNKVLEIGASNGYRLNEIRKKYNSLCCALEPSRQAVNDGKRRFPEILFDQGTASKLPYDDLEFELVIINFVFHWIDRLSLLRSVSEIDRVLEINGFLIIGDFYPVYPQKVFYHHLPDESVWTYKQNYFQIFTSSCIYELINLSSYYCKTPKKNEENISQEERANIAVLRKKVDSLYTEKKMCTK